MAEPNPPKQFSPDSWNGIPDAEKTRWWEGYAAGLNAAIQHASADGIEALTKEIVAAEEAAHLCRELGQTKT